MTVPDRSRPPLPRGSGPQRPARRRLRRRRQPGRPAARRRQRPRAAAHLVRRRPGAAPRVARACRRPQGPACAAAGRRGAARARRVLRRAPARVRSRGRPARRDAVHASACCGELARVPFGETATYAELAARAGNPKAARAVGMTMNRNPVPIVLPCHRVDRGQRAASSATRAGWSARWHCSGSRASRCRGGVFLALDAWLAAAATDVAASTPREAAASAGHAEHDHLERVDARLAVGTRAAAGSNGVSNRDRRRLRTPPPRALRSRRPRGCRPPAQPSG